MVFLRTTGFECERRDKMSGRSDMASEDVTMCGKVTSGSDREGTLGDTMS